MSKLPGLTYGTWDALRAGHMRRDAYAVPTPAREPDPDPDPAALAAAAPHMVTQLRGLLALHVAHHNHPVHAATRALLAELGVKVDV